MFKLSSELLNSILILIFDILIVVIISLNDLESIGWFFICLVFSTRIGVSNERNNIFVCLVFYLSSFSIQAVDTYSRVEILKALVKR